MSKTLVGIFLGLFCGSLVILYFGWVSGIGSLVSSPETMRMLFQGLVTGALTGAVAYRTRRMGLSACIGIVAGYSLGFILMSKGDQPWQTIGALAMLFPLVFTGALTALACTIMLHFYSEDKSRTA